VPVEVVAGAAPVRCAACGEKRLTRRQPSGRVDYRECAGAPAAAIAICRTPASKDGRETRRHACVTARSECYGCDGCGRGAASAPAATISFTGSGGAVPDGNATGASFDIAIPDLRLIRATGNNVTLTLINVSTPSSNPDFAPFGGLVDFAATLEHVGHGAPRSVFANVLNSGNFICVAGLNGTYTFRSGEPTTLRSQCGSGGVLTQPRLIAPGTYRTTTPDDTTDSGLSSAWNTQPAAGTWRLRIIDTNARTDPGQFVMSSSWSWRLDIDVAGKADCKKKGWRSFGVFKNQGDCVSYFATGGKNPPAGQATSPRKKGSMAGPPSTDSPRAKPKATKER
jgi:hypothetical protein